MRYIGPLSNSTFSGQIKKEGSYSYYIKKTTHLESKVSKSIYIVVDINLWHTCVHLLEILSQ